MLRTRGYTGKFAGFVIAGLVLLANRDFRQPETSRILSSFGLQSVAWTWTWLVVGAALTLAVAGFVCLGSYSFQAIHLYKDKEPIAPVEAGTVDVSFWCYLLSYMTTLLLAAWLPFGLWWLRPPLIVVVSVIGASVSSALVMRRIVRAIYGIGDLRETISRHQCDMRTIKGGRCQNWALRSRFRGKTDTEEKEFCRWHYIAILTAQRYHGRRSVPVVKQILAAFCLLYGLIGMWSFVVHGGIVWPAVSLFAVGACLRYLFESVVAPWHALSRLPLWSKLFTLGLTSEALGGIAFLTVVGLRRESIEPVVSLFGTGTTWRLFGPIVIYLFVAFVVGQTIDAIVARTLLYRSPSYASLVLLPTFLTLWNMLNSGLSQHWLFSRWFSDQFWRDVIGGEIRFPLGMAFLSGFYFPFTFLSRRIRESRTESTVVSFTAELAYFFVPVLVAVISIMASRYALVYLGLSGSALFIGASTAVSLTLTWLLNLLPRKAQSKS
jgi:putative effector of murein hydrolase LrgA (UPF0299 family)